MSPGAWIIVGVAFGLIVGLFVGMLIATSAINRALADGRLVVGKRPL